MAPRKTEDDELVPLGVITRPHGVRGEVRVHPFNPESPMWQSLEEVVLREPSTTSPPAAVPRKVIRARKGPKAILVQLEGCAAHEDADALRGAEVCVWRSSLPALDDDEYYLRDLIGMRAVKEDGTTLGNVAEVLEYPSVHCIRVEGECAVYEVPLLPRYVASVDGDANEVHVRETDELPEMKVS